MKCQMPIDPVTKIALEGEALSTALRDPDSPRCGYELHENDVFCPSCGMNAHGEAGHVAERTLFVRESSSSCFSVLHLIAGTIAVALYAVAVFYCSAAYTYACELIPIIILFIPLPLFFFWAVPGIATAMAYRRFEVNKPRLCLMLGAILGCVAVYGAWFWFVRYLKGVEEWNPFRLWGYAHEISAQRVVDVGIGHLGNGTKVTGGMLLFFYYLEALFIILMSGVVASFGIMDNLGFCSTCSRWMRGYFWKDANMTQDEACALVRRMAQDDKLEMPDGVGNDRCRFRFRLRYCKKCGQGELDVFKVAMRMGTGEKKEVETRVFRGLHLTKTQVASTVHILKYDNVMSDSKSIWMSDLGAMLKVAFIRFG